ncbi:MAG: c-type cytochrome [Fluviibacter sp.]
MKLRHIAGFLFALCSSHALMAAPAAKTAQADSVKRGEYLAKLGDCAACHTAQGGKPMAGGLELKTPFGKLYSTNITPDKQTGIGNYSFAQFDQAMRKGIAADGHNLYPAMPYPSYAKTSPADMQALYDYMMQGVSPVAQPNKASDMKWPFSMRWGLSLWNKLFLDDKPFVADTTKTENWNRGAYIVQGLGHCGSCHTPRGIAFQEKTMSQDGKNGQLFLAGSTVDAWHALSLRDIWAEDDIVEFLKTGRNQHATAFGTMTEVIGLSTQHFSQGDLQSIAIYLKSLPANKTSAASTAQTVFTPQAAGDKLYKTAGGLGYDQFCATCHRKDGLGVSGLFPPLAGNRAILSEDPTSAIHVTLSGWKSASTKGQPRVVGMPEFGHLTDDELADIVTFMRTTWGNQATHVTAAQIKKVRDQIELSPQGTTKFSTPRFANMLENSNPDQLINGMRLLTETKALLPDNVGNGLNCSSCHLNGGTVAKASPFVGIAAQFPRYAARAGREIDLQDRINGCFKRSMNGKPVPKKSKEMQAMVAYFKWMNNGYKMDEKIPGRGIGKIDPEIVANKANGQKIYDAQCAVCHGKNGQGVQNADGSYVFPAVWGEASFNIGAGMARTYTAAAFIKHNMPMGHSTKFPLGQGALSDQEAVDVAEYFSHVKRPDFPEKANDWPNGEKPKDARY